MIDNLQILLHINNWKQHVQLQLRSISVYKNIIRKIKAIVRLKKRHVNIKFKIFISKNYKRLESFIVALTGYEIIDIANAFASASFMLIFVKIGFFINFSFQIPFKFNLLLLIWFFGISLCYNINFYIRFGMYKIIKKTLGNYFFGILHDTWYNARKSIFADPVMFYGSSHNSPPPIKWPISSLGNFIAISIFTLLIQIRLFILSEPFLFFFCRFIVFYWLIFNKFLILTYFISIIVLLGRYTLLYQHNDMKSLKEFLTSVFIMKPIETIKPTYKNAFYILSSITSNILMDYDEKRHFYRTKKDPKNKFIEKYKYRKINENIGDTSKVWCKLENYFPFFDFEQDMYLEQTKRNKNILKILSFVFIIACIYIYISLFHISFVHPFDNEIFEIKSFQKFFLIIKLRTEKAWDFYNIVNYPNLFTKHPGLFFITFNETTKNLDIYMSNFTTVDLFKPNLNLNWIGPDKKYAYVKTIPKGILNDAGLKYLQEFGVDVTKEFNNKNLLDGATFLDASYVNKLRDNDDFDDYYDEHVKFRSTPSEVFQFFHNISFLQFHPEFNYDDHSETFTTEFNQLLENFRTNKFNTGAAKVNYNKTKEFQQKLQTNAIGNRTSVQKNNNNGVSSFILDMRKCNSNYSAKKPVVFTLNQENVNANTLPLVYAGSSSIKKKNIPEGKYNNERFGDVFDNDSKD